MSIMEVMNTVVTVVTMIEIGWRVARQVQRIINARRAAADDGDPLDPGIAWSAA